MPITYPGDAAGMPFLYASPPQPLGTAPPEATRQRSQQAQPNIPSHSSSQRRIDSKVEYLAKLENWKNRAFPQYRDKTWQVAARYEAACNQSGQVTLEIKNVSSLSSLPPIPPIVTFLKVINCPNLSSFPDLSMCKGLEYLTIDRCPRLRTLPELSQCRELKRLKCVACPSLTGRLDLLGCAQLSYVMWDCPISARLPLGMILNPDEPQLLERPTPRPFFRAPRSRPVSYVMPVPTTSGDQREGVPQLPFNPRPLIPAPAFSHVPAIARTSGDQRKGAPQLPFNLNTRIPASAFSHDPVLANSTGAARVRSTMPAPLEQTNTDRQRWNAARLPSQTRIRFSHGEALAAINTWKSNAPTEHRRAYEEIALKITTAWKDKSQTSLAISNRDITSLPPLPSHLTELNLMNCTSLTELPDLSSCLQLKRLQLAGCGELAELPDLSAHKALRNVNLMGVTIAGQPQRILDLPQQCSVMLEASCVIHEIYVELNEAMGITGYRGPAIRFLGSLGSGRTFTLRTLTNEVRSWMPAANESAWIAIQKEPNAHLFSQYLQNIRETADYKNWQPVMTSRVAALLAKLQRPENQALREECFNIAMLTTETCGDGIAKALLDMDLLSISYQAQADAENGKYNHNSSNLLALGKGMYLYESLKKIAQDKTQALEDEQQTIDETEVHYGYFLQFNAPILKFLGVNLKAMLYPRNSRITEDDVKAAADVLTSHRHQDEWITFLATWPPMHALLIQLGHKNIIDKVSARIAREQERICDDTDELFELRKELTDQKYQEKLNELTAEYGNIEKKINREEKQAVITKLLDQHRLDTRLL